MEGMSTGLACIMRRKISTGTSFWVCSLYASIHTGIYMYVSCTKFGSRKPADCPAQTLYASFAHSSLVPRHLGTRLCTASPWIFRVLTYAILLIKWWTIIEVLTSDTKKVGSTRCQKGRGNKVILCGDIPVMDHVLSTPCVYCNTLINTGTTFNGGHSSTLLS